MWQHKWALWSGFLGASASCFVKMGTGGNHSSPLLQLVQTHICKRAVVQAWLGDLDEDLLRGIHLVLGDLMIKHRINLMPYWRMIRRNIIQEFAMRLNLFEVDYCELLIVLPVRLACIAAMIVSNAYMLASFLRGMKESGSVAGTSLSTAANFASSAMYGKLLWNEPMNTKWCFGFACVLIGVVILSSVTTAEVTNDDEKTGKNVRTEVRAPPTSRKMRSIPSKVTPPPPLTIYTKSSSIPKRQDRIISKSKVASLRSSFMNNNNSNNDNDKNQNNTKNQNNKYPSPRASGVPITPSPRLLATPMFSKTATPKPPPTLKKTKAKEKEKLKPESALKQFYNFGNQKSSETQLISRSFLNECALCEGALFDERTGESKDAIADLSTNTCFHVFHAKCLKQATKYYSNVCPICETSLSMWTTSKEAAQFPGFWLERVENYLRAMPGAPKNSASGKEQCLSASTIRDYFQGDETLTESQKLYINDDPTGMDKGLQATFEWGGYIDYNRVPKGHVGFSQALRTRGIWKYDPKKDDIWLWDWGSIHPRQRCDQCQLIKRPLPVECEGCRGSSEAAYYCSASCAKRDRQRHQQTCDAWKQHGPKD